MKAQVIEYRGHTIEHTARGRWDAYLKNSEDGGWIYWESPLHSTLAKAKQAIDQRISRLDRQRRNPWDNSDEERRIEQRCRYKAY